jgi:hypothetical protein
MAPSPFRRRKAAKTVRNLAIAEAALALAKDRVGHGSRRSTRKLLAIGGAAVAAVGVAALLKRDKVAGLLPGRSGEPAPPAPAPPQQSNYDVPGPVANTATPVPAPDPQAEAPAPVDEAAEEAAAAAEAGAIGGPTPEYAGSELGERAEEAERPLAEGGEGEAEGQEQAEAELAENASYRDAGVTDTERQIDKAIEQADQPESGETPEPLATPGGGISGRPFSGLDKGDGEGTPAVGETPASDQATASDEATATGDSTAGDQATASDEATATEETTASDQPTVADESRASDESSATEEATAADESPATEETTAADEGQASDESGDDEWRTWSGRSVNP